jgi:hypothetical protein
MTTSKLLLRGKEFNMSPLTLGDLRRLESVLLGSEQAVAHGFSSMLSLVPVVHASLAKLHPELALEELEQMLDLHNFPEALNRVLEASGLKRASSGFEGKTQGENQPAAARAGSPTGHSSSATS